RRPTSAHRLLCALAMNRRSRVWMLTALLVGCAGEASDEPDAITRSAELVDELACEDADLDLSWASPTAQDEACAGPWAYQLNYSCKWTGPECDAKPAGQRACRQYPQCPHWNHGIDKRHSGWRTRVQTLEHQLSSGDPQTKMR